MTLQDEEVRVKGLLAPLQWIEPVPLPALALGGAAPRGQRRGWLLAAAVVAVVAATGAAITAELIGGSTATSASSRASTNLQKVQAAIRAENKARQAVEHEAQASTPVETLIAYTRMVGARDQSDLPPSVTELIGMVKPRWGSPTAIQEPIVGTPSAGTPSVYLVTMSSGTLCFWVGVEHFAGGCNAALRQADGSLSVSNTIVDHEDLVSGLAANNVSSVSVSLTSTPTTPAATAQAEVVNNAYVAVLPYDGGMAVGALTITATRKDGSTSWAYLPGLP